jgi:hypothetical protein
VALRSAAANPHARSSLGNDASPPCQPNLPFCKPFFILTLLSLPLNRPTSPLQMASTGAYKAPGGEKSGEVQQMHRIRITLTSKNVANLEKGECWKRTEAHKHLPKHLFIYPTQHERECRAAIAPSLRRAAPCTMMPALVVKRASLPRRRGLSPVSAPAPPPSCGPPTTMTHTTTTTAAAAATAPAITRLHPSLPFLSETINYYSVRGSDPRF